MKKTTKKILVLTLLLGILTFVTAGCFTSNGTDVRATFDLENQTIEREFGSLYKVNSVFEDEQGRKHDFAYTVTTKSGEKLNFYGGQFSLTDKEGYVIKYELVINGRKIIKTDTVNILVNSKPIILINGSEVPVFYGDSYTVPTATATDFYDGDLQTTVEIYRRSETGDIKCEYDGGGLFTAIVSGEHYVKATAKNSKNILGEATLSFFVRSEMENGEVENFDEETSIIPYQTTKLYSGGSTKKEFIWHSEYKGRTGVYSAGMKQSASDNDPTFLKILSKGMKENYQDYPYVAVTMYIEGDEDCVKNVRFTQKSGMLYGNKGFVEDVVVNAWKTYYLSVGTVFDRAWERESFSLSMLPKKECKVYIDRVYFAYGAELTGEIKENGNTITPSFTCQDKQLNYSVAYNGKAVAFREGSFIADYVGEYSIYPIIKTGDVVYTGSLTYNSQNGTSLRLNDYDKVIDPALGTYTLPSVTVVNEQGETLDGYTITQKVKSINYLGDESDTKFDIERGGVYRFEFVASKVGEKSLTTSVVVQSGYAENEFFKIGVSYPLMGLNKNNQKLYSEVVLEMAAPGGFNQKVAMLKEVMEVSLNCRYTLEELQELKKEGYKTLNFSVYVVDTSADYQYCYTGKGLIVRHNNGENYKFTTRTWTDFAVSIDNVIAELEESTDNSLLLVSKKGVYQRFFNEVYISNINFAK